MLTESQILKKLLGFDTQNSDKITNVSDTNPALDFVAQLLTNFKISVQFQDYEIRGNTLDGQQVTKKRKNLLAKINIDSGLPNIGLQGHIDTVPFGDYQGNPLGEERNGILFGRGAVDMKASLACMIYTMIQAKLGENISTNPHLIITSDEEANSFAGIKRYLQDSSIDIDFAICGEPTEMVVADRFKGAIWGTLDVFGKSGHGSHQHLGKNAIIEALPIIERLGRVYQQIQMICNPRFSSDEEYTNVSSMNFGVLKAGGKVNVIPEKCHIEFEIRPVTDPQQHLDLVSNILGEYANLIQYKFKLPPLSLDLGESEIVQRLDTLSKKRGVFSGFPEARVMNDKGIPTVVFGTGSFSIAHSREEYIEIESLKEYSKRLMDFLA